MTLSKVSKIRPVALCLVLTGLLSACAGNLLPGAGNDQPDLYLLTPKTTFPDDLPTVDWQLTIPLPVADAALNTARITLRQNPISLEYYARANLVDTAPQMIQTLLVESFENSGKIIGVGRQSVTLRADYSLLTDLREFQAEYLGAGPPRVRGAPEREAGQDAPADDPGDRNIRISGARHEFGPRSRRQCIRCRIGENPETDCRMGIESRTAGITAHPPLI